MSHVAVATYLASFAACIALLLAGLLLYVIWHDWGMTDSWSTHSIWSELLAVAFALAVVGIGCGLLAYGVSRPQTFEQWYTEHQKTCPECGGGADLAMCLDAFERMQAAFKEDRDREKKASN